MNLNELQESKKTSIVKKALREHYEMNIDFDKMSLKQSQRALSKVRGMLGEARSTKTFHESQQSAAYLKLVMMEQALEARVGDLRAQFARIVTENEDVQEAQVLLAAQDMIDTLQKMLEQVSKMNVEELNAVVQGIKGEFGSDKGDQFNQTVGQTLSTLQQAIQAAKSELESAQTSLTGQGGELPMGDMGGADLGMEEPMGDEGGLEAGAEMPPEEMPMPDEEPEDFDQAGRARR